MSEQTPHERAQQIVKQFHSRLCSTANYLHLHSRHIGQFALLSLRFGQLLTAVVIGVVYSSLIDAHRHHYCRFNPLAYQCRPYGRDPLDEVPWVYILVLFTVRRLAIYDSFLKVS